jgi:hypothetical protein
VKPPRTRFFAGRIAAAVVGLGLACATLGRGQPRGDPNPGRPDPLADSVRKAATELERADGFDSLMRDAKLSPEGTEFSALERLDLLRRAILERSGTPWDKASSEAREAATMAAFEGVLKVQRRSAALRRRASELLASQRFDPLVREAASGFDDLSSKEAFLDEAGMRARAAVIVQAAHPNEPEPVRKRLAAELNKVLLEKSRAAQAEFRRDVRFLFFGSPGVGTRDDFLAHQGMKARQDAIEAALWRAVRKQPRHARSLQVPFTRGIVAQQAKELAETIQGVKSLPAPCQADDATPR